MESETNHPSRADFISHYVHIKRRPVVGYALDVADFISHYVHIKPGIFAAFFQIVLTLYPTTFI